MRRVLPLVALSVVFAAPAIAGENSIPDLLASPEEFAGQEITVRGELVGDFLRRGDSVWVQLNGDAYAFDPLHAGGDLAGGNQGIGARFPAALFDEADFEEPGGYRVSGALIEATGIWRYHDPDRSGESYLDVSDFEVLERERRSDEQLPVPILVMGLALMLIGLAPPVLRRRRATRGD